MDILPVYLYNVNVFRFQGHKNSLAFYLTFADY